MPDPQQNYSDKTKISDKKQVSGCLRLMEKTDYEGAYWGQDKFFMVIKIFFIFKKKDVIYFQREGKGGKKGGRETWMC